ncbi:MAG: homoserine kinase [Nitrososphaerota archaeon]|nr:homoserine kinase [Nitrososphaerota archaeon]MDG7048646.1 homoserine kinase [Nitrososphaerota archaeon]MDG7051145.1 homoserine kinase [Nitrososphaerota archaeon]
MISTGLVKAKAYCSSANLGAGFDVVGVALDTFFDEVEIEVRKGNSVKLEMDGRDISAPNTASAAVKFFLQRIGREASVVIRLKKGVPTGLGLGSSGASAAAASYAINEVFGRPLDPVELVDIAAKSEGAAAAGTAHADNVAASLLGGFAFITSTDPFKAFSLKPRGFPGFYIAIPPKGPTDKKTKAARQVLPNELSLRQSIAEKAALLSMINAILTEDYISLAKALSLETPVELARYKAGLIPYYSEIKAGLLKGGALGVCISGAGPSVLAYGTSPDFKRAIEEVYDGLGIKVDVRLAGIAPPASSLRVD